MYIGGKKNLRLQSWTWFLKEKNIILNLSKIDLDLFRIINAPASGYYVSEKLKTAIEKEGFTGFAFREITEMDDKINVLY